MTTDSESPTIWKPCPQGTLAGLSVGLKRRRHREELQRVGGVVSVWLIALTAGWFAVRSTGTPQEFHYGGISCTEVCQSMADDMTDEVDNAIAARIDAHLAECPQCREFMRTMRPIESKAGLNAFGGANNSLVSTSQVNPLHARHLDLAMMDGLAGSR